MVTQADLTAIMNEWFNTRHFVTLDTEPESAIPENLTWAIGHIGIIDEVHRMSEIGPGKKVPTGRITVRYVIEDEERITVNKAALFKEVPKAEVPKNLIKAFDRHKAKVDAALNKAVTDFGKAEKETARKEAERLKAIARVEKEAQDAINRANEFLAKHRKKPPDDGGTPSGPKDPTPTGPSGPPPQTPAPAGAKAPPEPIFTDLVSPAAKQSTKVA